MNGPTEREQRRHCDLYEGLHHPHTHQEVRPVYFCDGRPPEPCSDPEPHGAHAYRTRDDGWQRERNCDGIMPEADRESSTLRARVAELEQQIAAVEAWPEALRSGMREYGDQPADLAASWLRYHTDRLLAAGVFDDPTKT